MSRPVSSLRDLALRSLVFHWRSSLGVLAGAMLGALVLVGALLVGDSVRGSLLDAALARIGKVQHVLDGGGRHFRASLADEVAADVPGAIVAPAWFTAGVASAGGGARRARVVSVYGVDGAFTALAPRPNGGAAAPDAGEVWLSTSLARQLGVELGEEVVLRVETPSALPRDMILATTQDALRALRVRYTREADDTAFGRFSLRAEPGAAYNALLDREWLTDQLEVEGRANLLIAGGQQVDQAALDAAIQDHLTAGDAQLEVELLSPRGVIELSTPRVFLDGGIEEAARRASAGLEAYALSSYFVLAIEASDGSSTPYSTVTGIGPLVAGDPGAGGPLPTFGERTGELLVNPWLRDDLGLEVGDEVALRYFVPGPDRRLTEASRAFRVSGIWADADGGVVRDPELMPAFPGLDGRESCRDWDPGIPVELDELGDEDQAYWEEYRGTPKAVVALADARDAWGSRFGALTGVRIVVEEGVSADIQRERFEQRLTRGLSARALGLFFQDVRTPALAATKSPTDFGGLFIGLSMFLIAAALLLTSLVFRLGVEARTREAGLLGAVGFRARDVQRVFVIEGACLALLGSIVGALLGTQYTQALVRGLASVWSGAVAEAPITYHATPLSLVGGALGAFAVALLTLRRAVKKTLAREPLTNLRARVGDELTAGAGGARRTRSAALLAALSAVALVLAGRGQTGTAASGAFFGAGSLLLVAGLALVRLRLSAVHTGASSLYRLAMSNATRRPGRSLAVVAMLASGTFLVASVGVHHKSAHIEAGDRASGTGGFALFGRSNMPLHHDLDDEEGRGEYGLEGGRFDQLSSVPLRVARGDDASCLNLNAPQVPRLAGVDPARLAQRAAFTFGATIEAVEGSGWSLLEQPLEPVDGVPVYPGVVDAASAQWTLKKAIGDDIEYTDDHGEPFRVRIVGTLVDSVLQGFVVVSESAYGAHLAETGGYRLWLIDAPLDARDELAQELSRRLPDVGLELVPAEARLARLFEVQNTYLAIFQVLGGLGVLLGSLGVGLVVLRNALERRGELALAAAVGFRTRDRRMLLVYEHAWMLVAGLLVGALAAGLALVPVLRAGELGRALGVVAPILLLLGLSGVAWVMASAWLALRVPLVRTLREW